MDPISHLTLYVHPSWHRKGLHSPLLNPWWGNVIDEASVLAKQMFDTYAFDTTCYTITDEVQAADMVFAPYRHNWLVQFDPQLLAECAQAARSAHLPLLIDGSGDIEKPLTIKNAYILRIGGYRFIHERGRIIVPLLADDLLEHYRSGRLEVRPKGKGKPVVGFAGWTNISSKQYVRTLIKELPVRFLSIFDARYRTCTKGVIWRQKAIRALNHSSHILFNLRARSSFSASQKTAEGDMQALREEMVDTILRSDYALDVRGDANNSTRLFEILSLGRIPIIVDTERNLPFRDTIDYSSFALMVDFRDINRLPEIVAEFHRNISPERFEEMQKNARDVYVNYFRIDALMRPLVEELRARINA